MLAGMLSQVGPGPMVDKTGLTSAYDFELIWDESSNPSLFTAMQQQLGRKLEPQEVPLFLFDSAQFRTKIDELTHLSFVYPKNRVPSPSKLTKDGVF